MSFSVRLVQAHFFCIVINIGKQSHFEICIHLWCDLRSTDKLRSFFLMREIDEQINRDKNY
jgi:hypothetical protein